MDNTIQKFEFLDTTDSEENFANCDIALRAGRHIQNHYNEVRLYDYVSSNFPELRYLYMKLFGLELRVSEFRDNRYYFLDFTGDSKGKYGGNRSDRLSTRHTLFGLLLLKIHRLENHFGSDNINLSSLKDRLKSESTNYREDIYRLFARVSGKGTATELDETNIDTWIENSLTKFQELGWIYVDPETPDLFTMLPSFNRLFDLYLQEIKDFDQLFHTGEENI